MKVMIMGGTGLIGRKLTQALLAAGHQVWVLSRNPSKARLANEVAVTGWDARSTQGWGTLVNEMDAVVNLAGENIGASRWTGERLALIRTSRIQAGAAVAMAIKEAQYRPQVLVQASAVGYYGTVDDRPLDEVSPPGNDVLAKICLDWEASTQPVEELGVRRVVIRTGVVLDKREGALPRMALPFRLFAGGPLGSGRQWLPWIHLNDEVAAICYLIGNENARGAFNLTAPQPVTNAEFGKALAKVLRRPYWMPVPASLLRLVLGDMSLLVLEGQRPLPRRLTSLGFRFQYDDVEEALCAMY